MAGMRQVEEQATNLSSPRPHLQVLASSLHLLEYLQQQPGCPVLAVSLCSVRNSGSRQNGQRHRAAPLVIHTTPTTPGNSSLCLGPWSTLHSTCSKNHTHGVKRHSHSRAARSFCYFNRWVNWKRAPAGHSQGARMWIKLHFSIYRGFFLNHFLPFTKGASSVPNIFLFSQYYLQNWFICIYK